MFYMDSSLLILTALTLAISLLYFYIFKKNREKYISYWGLSWTMYTASLILSIFLLQFPAFKLFIALKRVFDLFSSLFLLAGTYVFIDKKMPSYWIQFTLINMLWIGLAVYYNLSYITITLLASVFFNIIALTTGVMLLRFWKMNNIEKIIVGTIFFVWGLHKSYFSYLYPGYWNSPVGYTSEIILANILNFSILIIYLQKIRNKLTESEKRFRLLAENARDLIYFYRFKPNICFEYVSPSSFNITGYMPQDFYQDPYLFEKLTHPDDRPFLDILNESKNSLYEPVTLRWRHKEGHYIWTEQHTTIIYDEGGNISAVEGIIRDITDRKRVEENLIQAEKSRQSLLANISHELRTPITSILGYITAMIDGTVSIFDTRKDYLNLIYAKTHRLQRIVQDLFQLTQLESGQLCFNFSQITVKEMIIDIVSKYEWDVRHAEMDFQMDMNGIEEYMDHDVIVDIERIDQVFSNIIFNSIKNTPGDGRITISIEKFIKSNKDYILVKVIDTGRGIDEDDLMHIFERFYRGKRTNTSSDGSGLGLTISKEIVEFHKGEIWAESSLHIGTTLCFTLPVYCSKKKVG